MKKAYIIVTVLVLLFAGYFLYTKKSTPTEIDKTVSSITEVVTPAEPTKQNTDRNVGNTGKESGKLLVNVMPVDKSLLKPVDEIKYTDSVVVVKALNDLKSRIEGGESTLGNWNKLGVFYKGIGELESAKNIWEYTKSQYPQDYLSYVSLGDLYQFFLNDKQKAEENLKKVIVLKPEYTPAYINLHNLYANFYKEKADLAAGALLDGLKNNPNAVDIMVTLADYYAGAGNDPLSAGKYYKMAIDQLDKIGDKASADSLRTDLERITK
jgi:tetratricopeptide (TPR) repeat protein